jgi:hypothetical protein
MAEPRNLDSQRPSEKPIEIGGTGKARTSLVSERTIFTDARRWS